MASCEEERWSDALSDYIGAFPSASRQIVQEGLERKRQKKNSFQKKKIKEREKRKEKREKRKEKREKRKERKEKREKRGKREREKEKKTNKPLFISQGVVVKENASPFSPTTELEKKRKKKREREEEG